MPRIGKTPDAGLLLWHLLALATLGLWLPELKFHVPLWKLRHSELSAFEILLAGYAACALLSVSVGWIGRQMRIGSIAGSIGTLFAFIFLYFLIAKVGATRVLMAQVFVTAMVLVPLALYAGRWRWFGVAALAIAVVGGAAFTIAKGRGGAETVRPRTESTVLRTAFYNVKAVSFVNFAPQPAVRGGGISRLGDQFVLATGDGLLYVFGWPKDPDSLSIRPLRYRVPVNGDEFAMDTTGGPWRTPREGDARGTAGEDAGGTVIAWWFRTAGLLVQERGDQVRLFASHYFWKRAEACWVERVSLLEGARSALLGGDASLQWRTVFETTPCLPIKGEGRRRGTPFAGHFGGGRMVMYDPETLLLTVGDFGFNGVSSKWMAGQDMSASYGKTILVHLHDGRSEVFTAGHRNPQGLYRDPTGRIWETEHGPEGGDELNLIKRGLNYGWPIVTYGVDYGSFGWPLNPKQGEQEGFEAPYFAWLPDVGISDLVGVEKDLFPVWKGDLLVSTLAGKKVFRVRLRNDRVVYEEPLEINRRIRDITEGSDGRIVLWCDDDNAIVSLRPVLGSSSEVAFATACSGCHKVGDGTVHRIGPDLWGVIGRKVAAADGYSDYSAALRGFGGRWTEGRLDSFIKSPAATVPGTAMDIAGVNDAQVRAQIIDYLRNAEKVEPQ